MAVYYRLGSVYRDDCKSVIIPIYEANLDLVPVSIQAALNYGFGLQWRESDNEECNRCSLSGGQCGYDGGQFSCFCKDGPHETSCSGSKKKLGLLFAIAIPVGVGLVLIVISILTIYICKERRASHDYNPESFMRNYGSSAPKKYSYEEVERMTNSFRDKLGEGGYGVVYKASPPDRPVAVKVIKKSKVSEREFMNQVVSISRTSHVNIVSLLGFCNEGNKRALIYEYMSKGSLDKFIYKRGLPDVSGRSKWEVSYQIAIGIARGLGYLHRGCNKRILHLNIKPQNILLDERFSPKISDFGLAKENIVSIQGRRGTRGFIAPEVYNREFGGVSHKADVYSYGMLVLKMVGGRKNYDSGGSQIDEEYFLDWIYKDLEHGKHPASSIERSEEDDEMVWKMTLVSLWCIQTNQSDRPAMNKVVEMLEGSLQSLSVPPKPTLQNPKTVPVTQFLGRSSQKVAQINSISS